MPRDYNPLTGHELGLAIDNQVRKALQQRPDLFGHHLTYRAFRFAVGISIEFLDGRGEGRVASESLSTPETAQGEFAAQLANPALSGKVWIGVGFSHLLTLPPDQARAELHLPTKELAPENGQMIEKEVPPPFDPDLDPPRQGQATPPVPSPTPAPVRQPVQQAAQPEVPSGSGLSESEIAEMFEAPPPPSRASAPDAASTGIPQTAAVPVAPPPVPQLDPQRAAQLSAQARANPRPSDNNPFNRTGPIEPRDVQTLRPRPPHQTIQERLNNEG